jgi:hypothetical protein
MDTATALASTLAYGRIALGLAMVAAPGPVGGRWMGSVAGGSDAAIAVRGLGVRDVALGAATLGTMRATGTGGTGFKVLTGLGVVVDVVDVVSTLAAGDEVPDARTSAAVAGLAGLTGVAVLALSGTDG